jgi:hypothetical protein
MKHDLDVLTTSAIQLSAPNGITTVVACSVEVLALWQRVATFKYNIVQLLGPEAFGNVSPFFITWEEMVDGVASLKTTYELMRGVHTKYYNTLRDITDLVEAKRPNLYKTGCEDLIKAVGDRCSGGNARWNADMRKLLGLKENICDDGICVMDEVKHLLKTQVNENLVHQIRKNERERVIKICCDQPIIACLDETIMRRHVDPDFVEEKK